ncbi:MAG: hypothetical protein HY058_15415 [Proteobacteria bacterium]|nr:hypothetical protein [Pseudomonadota bacterium]
MALHRKFAALRRLDPDIAVISECANPQRHWLSRIRGFSVGTFEEWCGSGLSDHVPVAVDIALETKAVAPAPDEIPGERS